MESHQPCHKGRKPELSQELQARRKELLETRCQVSLGEDVRPHQIKVLRQDIARIMTVLTEKRREAAAAPAGDS